MKRDLTSARLPVPRRRASLNAAARAALEMTASCFVWIERDDDGVVVSLTERNPLGQDLRAAFDAELDRVLLQERLEKKTRHVRSAIVGRALGPLPRREPAPQPMPSLDPETEAEIEKLLAEIESDDWLDDAGEIAKTWEERFGGDPSTECKEES